MRPKFEKWLRFPAMSGRTLTLCLRFSMGLASRASGLLSAAKTSQTLWLHGMSRQLGALAMPGPATVLAKALQPMIKLSVVQVLPLGIARSAYGPFPSPTRRDEAKLVVTQCRLVHHRQRAKDHDDSELEAVGTVVFTLQDHAPASSQAPVVPPIRRTRSDQHATTDDTAAADARTVFVPLSPHDLRFVERGAEVWVWDPFYEVVVSDNAPRAQHRPVSPPSEQQKPSRHNEEDEGTQASVEVVWQDPAVLKADTRAEEKPVTRPITEGNLRIEKGLICGRFAVLV